MVNVISTVQVLTNKQWDYSSSVVKSGLFHFNGRSASIFRISTKFCINPCC
jgi:hypothetical protein